MRHGSNLSLFALTTVLIVVIAGGTTAFAQTPGFLSVSGTLIVDSTGKPMLLRGVNFHGYHNAHPRCHEESDYANFAQNGFNVVRLQNLLG
jgi:hypothetical protein